MIQNGIYFIIANHAGEFSYLALDVPGGNTANGVIIQQFGYHGGPNQQWQITNVGSDLFTIVNIHTQKALDVPGGFPIVGLPIQQYQLHGGPNQRWRFQTIPAVRGPQLYRPEVHRIRNSHTNLALDVPDGSQAFRVKIQQWTPHNGWNQTWLLRRRQ